MTVRVRFEPSGFEANIPQGTALMDVTDEHPEADVPYSCRMATCGTCRIRVLQGMEHLAQPEADELDVLAIFMDDPKQVRLCCQTKVISDEGRVVVQPVED